MSSPALTGLRESRARAGAGERGPGSTSARRPPAGLVPKLPQQAKSMRADLSGNESAQCRRSALPSVQPDVLAVYCSAKDLVYSRLSSLSFRLSVVHVQPQCSRGGAGRGEGDLARWAHGRLWGTGSPGVPCWPQIYRALEMSSGEGQEALKPELALETQAPFFRLPTSGWRLQGAENPPPAQEFM